MPPITSTSITSALRWKSNTSSEAKPLVCASSAPAAPAIAAGDRVDRDQARVHRQADAGGAQPVVAQRLQREAERRMDEAARDQQARRPARPACRRRRRGRRGRTRSAPNGVSGPITTPCRPSAPPVSQSSLLASSYRIEATPSVTISRVRSVPRRISTLVASAEQRAARDRDGQADQRIGHHVLGEQRRGVRAEAEERGVAERDDAGVAEDQVERDREQREDRDLVEQQRMRRQQQPRQRQRREQRQLPPAPARRAAQRARRGRERARRGVLIAPPAAREQALRPQQQDHDHQRCRR